MDYKLVRKNVLFRFRDYPNAELISAIIDEVYPNIEKNYNNESNITEEINCSMLIGNNIYYELLKSSDESDKEYIKGVIYKVINTINNVRERHNKDRICIDNDTEVYEYCKNNYVKKELFISFVQKYVTEKYTDRKMTEMEKEEMIEILKKEIKILSEFQKYEKKLKFKL